MRKTESIFHSIAERYYFQGILSLLFCLKQDDLKIYILGILIIMDTAVLIFYDEEYEEEGGGGKKKSVVVPYQ